MKTSHLPRSKNIPSVVLIKQHFSVPKEADVREATVRELKKLFPDTTAIKGKIVGLTCPSRGIRDIAQVLITAVSFLKPHCKEVRILTAMGTHGGGTSEGERAMASDRGVTEEAVGTRIFSNMETRYIDTVNDVEAHVSEDALACDLVILTNRIKEHTDIDWPEPLPEGFYGLESGWTKILALGASKLRAIEQHRHIPTIGLGAAIEISSRRIIEGKELVIWGGLGIIENARDETAEIISARAESADRFFAIEAQALARSKELMPAMPVRTVDVLYCNSLGKDLSGQGMHTKTIGRSPYGYQQGKPWKSTMPAIHTIVGSRLSPGSHGNAIGVGLCEFITQRFDEEIEWDRTTLNSLSALCPCQARRPIVCEHDRDALEVALVMSPSGPDGPRMVFIHSTLKMEHALLSEGLLNDARANSNLETLSDPSPLRFSSDGYVDLESYFRFGH
jgi:hypothetical protein